MPYNPAELYVTDVETEAYTLAGLLCEASISSYVKHEFTTHLRTPFFVVVVRERKDDDAARAIREPYLKRLRENSNRLWDISEADEMRRVDPIR